MATIIPTARPTLFRGHTDPTTGRLTGGNLVINDIAEFFGLSRSSSLDQICTAAGINKWAKYKPVEPQASRYSKPLSDAQLSAVHYGLTVGVSQTHWNQLDAVDFSYTPPSTCYRISDFDGYYHNARCPISGECWLQRVGDRYAFSQVVSNNQFYIVLLTSVEAEEISAYELYGLTETQLRGMYPCIKVGDYVHCLKNASRISGTTADYTQMYDTANSTYFNQFEIDISDGPFTQGNTYSVTVFLTNSVEMSTGGGQIDIRNTWYNVGGDDALQQSEAFAVLGIINLTAYYGAAGVASQYYGLYASACALTSYDNDDATFSLSVGYDSANRPTENVNGEIQIVSLTYVDSFGNTATMTPSGASVGLTCAYNGIRPVIPAVSLTIHTGLVQSFTSAVIKVTENGYTQYTTRTINITSS